MKADVRRSPQAGRKPSLCRLTLFLATLLVLPLLALGMSLRPPLLWYALGYGAVISWLSGLAYASDKRKARAAQWRTSETTLHVLDLLGGWPGGYLTQRWYRHKTAKPRFQVVFWLTVVVFQLVALDCLFRWTVLDHVMALLREAVHR